MMSIQDVKDWLDTLPSRGSVGIDEGGLCLRHIFPDDSLSHAYCEIGGIPEEIESPNTGTWYKCENCGIYLREEQLCEIEDLLERVAPGEVMPAGECPDCGAVCHEAKGGRR